MARSSTTSATRTVARFWFAVAAAALVLLCVTFAGRLSGDFVWDDVPLIENNRALLASDGWRTALTRDLWGGAGLDSTQLYHPLPVLTLWVQVQLHGLSMPWLRAGNVLLHGTCGLLLVSLLLRLGAGRLGAALVAGMFLVHPLVTEPVMWLTGRHDTVAALFSLLALLAFRQPLTLQRSALSGLCCAAAFASKEPYVIVPGLVALQSLLERPKPAPLARLALHWLAPVSGVLLVFVLRGALGIPSGSGQLGASLIEHARNYATIVQHYFVLIFTFDQGATIATFQPFAALPALLLLAFALLLLGALSRTLHTQPGRAAFFGSCWFLLALLPHVVALPVLGIWGNRYGYFPLLGALLVVGSALTWVQEQDLGLARHGASVAVAGCLLYGVLQTRLAAGSFHDDLTLYGAAVDANPEDGRALYHLAHAVRTRSDCARAVSLFQRASELDPSYPRAQRNLAGCWLDLGQPGRAVEPARRAVLLEPHVASHRYNLGAALIGSGDVTGGVAQLRRALELNPGHLPSQRLLARLAER